MSELLVITVVSVGVAIVVVCAVRVWRAFANLTVTIESQHTEMASVITDLTARISALEQDVSNYGQELNSIRTEFAIYITREDTSGIDYEEAVKAAASGQGAEAISGNFGLRDSEAQLLVAVYGSAQAI